MRHITLIALMLLTFPASASAAAVTAEQRQAAKAFADAAFVFTKEVWDARPAIQAELDATLADRVSCLKLKPAVRAAVARVTDERPQDERLIFLTWFRSYGPLAAAVQGPAARFVAALDAVRTTHPVLRKLRVAWRAEAKSTAALARYPADACAHLLAWDRGGQIGVPLPGVGVDLDKVAGLLFGGPVAATGAVLAPLGLGAREAERVRGKSASRALAGFGDQMFREWAWVVDVAFENFD